MKTGHPGARRLYVGTAEASAVRPMNAPHHASLITAPVAADVATTRVLEPDPGRAHRTIGSPRNELIVISAADLEAVREAEGVQVVRARYAGTACLVAVDPDHPFPRDG